MTIKNTQTYVIYQADGAATQWDIPFPFLQKEDMEVYLLDEAGNKSLLAGDFEIDEENKIFYYPQPDSDAPPLSSDKRLLLQRRTPLCQETEFLAQQSFDPLILEQGYDKAMMIAQELANEVSRAVKFPPQSAQTQTDAAAYLQALQQAKQDAEKATAAANQSMDTASAAAQTAVEASKVAGAVLENLQHYVASAESARDTAQQAKQEVLTVQENILQARQESQAAADLAQESAQQAMDVQEKLSSAEAEARQSALTAQTCAESAAQVHLKLRIALGDEGDELCAVDHGNLRHKVPQKCKKLTKLSAPKQIKIWLIFLPIMTTWWKAIKTKRNGIGCINRGGWNRAEKAAGLGITTQLHFLNRLRTPTIPLPLRLPKARM